MRKQLVVTFLTIAVLAAPALRASAPTAITTTDCNTALDLQAARAELFAFKFGSTRAPDVLYDKRWNGDEARGASIDHDSWTVDEQWYNAQQPSDRCGIAITFGDGRMILDSGGFSTFVYGIEIPQSACSMDGVRPQVTASSWGYEVRFRALRQVTPDQQLDCAAGGDPAVGMRPVRGYNIYRLAGAGSPSLAQFRVSGYVGYVDARATDRLAVNVADADGFGCADLATGDEARLINPNGIADDGDEVIVFRDWVRTPSGRPRTGAPSATQAYLYRVQPVIDQDPDYYVRGQGVAILREPVSEADRDGNGTMESIDLLGDGSYELIDPGVHGLGLTWGGEIFSSPMPGVATPGAAPADPDGDGIPTADETVLGLNPNVSNATTDSDNDGPLDRLEAESGSNPKSADTDGSGERDGREMFYGRSPSNRCDDIVVTRPLGDIAPSGGDGLVNVQDVVRLLRISVGLETATTREVVTGDVAPAELVDATQNPDAWRRHGDDAAGSHPYGRLEHGDGLLDIRDVVIALQQSVGLLRVTD